MTLRFREYSRILASNLKPIIGQDYYIHTTSRKFIHTKFFFLIDVFNVRNVTISICESFFGLSM